MGGRLSDFEELQNIRELGEFRSYWRDSPEYPRANYANNHVKYPVDVIYKWKNGSREKAFFTEFRAYVGSGPDDGRIDLTETDDVSVNTHHLSFSPAFQHYKYDDTDHALIISASSPKMGGSYLVRVRPSLQEP